MKCVKDQNGNHVIQRAIQVVPAEHVAFIIDAFKNQVQSMAVHPYGCRVIQRMLEHCDDVPRRSILIELRPTIAQLLTDQYGNYVSQHILKYGDAADRAEVINMVKDQLLLFSKHKHASNVVEHCLKWANPEQKRDIMLKLIEKPERGESLLAMLLRDGYGNYVIRKHPPLIAAALALNAVQKHYSTPSPIRTISCSRIVCSQNWRRRSAPWQANKSSM